jgi:hypothetical protein
MEDEPEDVANAMHASVWDGEFSNLAAAFLIHVSNLLACLRSDEGLRRR